MKRAIIAAVTTLTLAGVLMAATPALAKAESTADAKKWALKWSRQVKKNRRHALAHAQALRQRLPVKLKRSVTQPAATSAARLSKEDWKAYGRACRAKARALAKYVRATWRTIRNPRGSSVSRWLPLLRHEGWPAATHAMCLRVITRESGGNPSLIGSGGYYGLFQMASSFSHGRYDLRNPVVNVRLARQLYSRRGWQPWASTAY